MVPATRIIAHLPDAQLRRVQSALRDWSVRPVDRLALLSQLRDGSAAVAVLDPVAYSDEDLGVICAAAADHGTKLVLRSERTAFAYGQILKVCRFVEPVATFADDSQDAIVAEVHSFMAPASMHAMRLLAGKVQALPYPLRFAVCGIIVARQTAADCESLAALAGMPQRTVSRRLLKAGLASAAAVVTGARLLHAYDHLNRISRRVANAAQRVGYTTARALERAMRDVARHPPSTVCQVMSSAEFATVVARRVQRHGGGPSACTHSA